MKERILDVGSGKAQYQGWRTFLRADAQRVCEFLKKSFACPWEF